MKEESFNTVEEEALDLFQKQLSQEGVKCGRDPSYLIRWLRARNLDIGQALKMLKASLKWREENKVDGIVEREEIPERIRKWYPTGYFGHDAEGNVVMLLPLGRDQYSTAIRDFGYAPFIRYSIVWMESILDRVSKAEVLFDRKGLQVLEIIDMEHISYKEMTQKAVRDFILENNALLEANYPEMLKSMVIVNAATVFSFAYKLVKPFLPEETLRKIEVYGTNREEWVEALKKRGVDMTKVPPHWGGTLEGEDDFCSTDVDLWAGDGPIPLEYFTRKSKKKEWASLKHQTKVGPRDRVEIHIDVLNEGSLLSWKFETKDHDIAFGLACPDGECMVEMSRVNSQEETQEGCVTCSKKGVYRMTFDNKYSLRRAKVVRYSYSVVDKDEELKINEIE